MARRARGRTYVRMLELQRANRYMEPMAKGSTKTTETVVRDSKSGRFVTVRGIGALKGHMTIRKGVDLTKPIASQALKGSRGAKTLAPDIIKR